MKCCKLLIPLIIMALLLIPIATAQISQQNINPEVGLQIGYPPFEYMKQNEAFEFDFHVYNKTDGMIMNNETTSCSFFLYNSTGREIVYASSMSMATNLKDFYIIVPAAIFAETGSYAYITTCNTSFKGGYLARGFEVTPDGMPTEDYNNYSFLIIILVLVGLAALAFTTFMIVKATYIKVLLITAFAFIIMITLRFLAWFVEITNPNEIEMIDSLNFYYLMGVRLFWITLIFAVFYALLKTYQTLVPDKKEQRKQEWGE